MTLDAGRMYVLHHEPEYVRLRINDDLRQLIFKTTNPFGNNWSDPVHFEFNGYDTSLFWDDDDRCVHVESEVNGLVGLKCIF